MKKSRFTEEQIAFALKQAELGTSNATFYIYGLPPFCKL
ncbi:UNVERIFIED_ORG: putative transposase [Rahnella aquatilis]